MARSPRRRAVLAGRLSLAVALVLALTVEAFGQAFVRGSKDDDVAENAFIPADRHTLLRLSDAKRLVAERRFGEAVRCLDAILDGPEDFFFRPGKTATVYRSLKTEAQRLIRQMPREGRDAYELQYGARARRMLDDAIAAGDIAAVAEVSRRFFHTKSGYQATLLLGLDHFDRGRPLTGAMTLQRLREAGGEVDDLEPSLSLTTAACWLQAGVPDKARETLIALRQRQPSLRVAVGGREVPIFTDDAMAVEWLTNLVGAFTAAGPAEADHWLMFGGNAARNATTAGGLPLMNLRWRVAATDNPIVGARLAQFKRSCADDRIPAIPAMHPLVIDDVLLMRTTNSLLGVDFVSGKRLWEVSEEDPTEIPTGASTPDRRTQQAMVMSAIAQRVWTDMTYGTLSSDGRSVFAIEDLDLVCGRVGNVLFRFGGQRAGLGMAGLAGTNDEQIDVFNRLEARDVRTGKLQWKIGGPVDKKPLPQAGTFFLGPPLPLLGQLYVLGEVKGEVRLIVLDAATGNLLWSQQLAMAEQGVVQDPLRRGAGLSPSCANGIIVCPTSTGAVVAVDQATRSLLWGYRCQQERSRNRQRVGLIVSSSAQETGASRWTDTIASIVDGRVLVTPIESDWLYCLSLIDGKEIWKAPRKNDLYLACVDHENVVLVGSRSVRALRLADGKPAWRGRTIDLLENAAPSGRGFLADDRYYLPLSTAEVAAIDVRKGRIVQTAKSRSGTVPGNLVCYRGKLVSQGFDGVDEFYQLDAVRQDVDRRLAANADDAEALSLRGETLLDAGRRSEGVASLERAYQLDSNPRTRELLRDALFDGLREEFAAYRDRGPAIERLIDDPSQTATYLRLMANGLRQTGQWADAFDRYQKLIDLEPRQRSLDTLSKSLTVRRDRWLQSQLASVRNEAGADAAARIDAAVQTRLQAAMSAGSIDALRQFVDYFGNQPVSAAARRELVRRLQKSGQRLDAELTSRDEPAKTTASPAVPSKDAWPVGLVESSSLKTTNPTGNGYGRYPIEMRGDPGPFLSDLVLHYDESRHLLLAADGRGRQQWQISLDTDGQRQNFGFNRAWTHACARNHLLLVALGWRVVAIDTLGFGPNGTARLLWTQELITSDIDPTGASVLPWALPTQPWLWQRQFGRISERSRLVGPITDDYVCIQTLRSLVAVDPRDGQLLWTRSDVSPGSDLFGDEDHVFVLPPDQKEAMVLRALDGQQVGTCRVPRVCANRNRFTTDSGNRQPRFLDLDDYCLATLGRRLLLWWPEDDRRVLTLSDPLEGRDLWPDRSFPSTARACVVGDKAVGVMQPDGRFVLIGIPDGKTIADVQLDAEPTLMDIDLLADDQRYFLLVRGASRPGARARNVHQTPGCNSKLIHYGRLYAFDRQGKLQWPAPTVIQNRFLLSNQPSQLPLLTSAGITYKQDNNGAGRQRLSLLAIDKRNGRIAYKGSFADAMGLLDITGDTAKKTIDLVMQRDTVRLTFTDKPWPVDSKPKPKPSGKVKAFNDLWRSVKDLFDIDSDDEEDE